MTYPLLFPNGEQALNCNLAWKKNDGSFEEIEEIVRAEEDSDFIE